MAMTAYMVELITRISKKINDDSILKQLNCLKESCAFSAPEVIPSRLHELFVLLSSTVPNNTEIKTMYVDGVKEFIRRFPDVSLSVMNTSKEED